MVLASLPAGLPAAEWRRRLFERIYGYAAPFADAGSLQTPRDRVSQDIPRGDP